MPSDYPNSYDNLSSNSNPSLTHRDVAQAIEALQTTVGLAPWTNYTPSFLSSSGSPAVGNGSFAGTRYKKIGKTVLYQMMFQVGSTTVFGAGTVRFTLPSSPKDSVLWPFDALYHDSGTGYVRAYAFHLPSNPGTLELMAPSTVAAGYDRSVSATVPFTFANGDQIFIKGVYDEA